MEAAHRVARHTHWPGKANHWLEYFSILGNMPAVIADPRLICDLLFAGQGPDGAVQAPGASHPGALSLPVQGLLLGEMLRALRHSEALTPELLRGAFHHAIAQHRHLYEHRDPAQEGLIAVFYPEEDGFGDNPAYAKPGRGAIQDPFFNTCLTWSNEALITLGCILKEDVMEALQWHELTIHTMNEKLWDEAAGQYQAFDLDKQQAIPLDTLAGLLPLACGAPTQEQAECMLRVLELRDLGIRSGIFFRYPSCRTDAAFADFRSGWRGCIWPALNWMLYRGLLRYDFTNSASRLKGDCLHLIAEYGFHDAFVPHAHPRGHPGIGAPSSPAAAALSVHWLLQ